MKYTIKRIAMLFITMLGVSFLTFLAFDIISGDPVTNMLGTEASIEQIALLRSEMGLDKPFLYRYLSWLKGFVTFDLGTSYDYNIGVWELISSKVGVTVTLSLLSFLMIIVISIPLGLLSSRFTSRISKGCWNVVIQLMMSVPSFFISVLITWICGITLHLFNHGDFPGFSKDFGQSLYYLIFPSLALAIPRIATSVRMIRSIIQKESKEGYIRTCIAKGNSRGRILRCHILKNTLVPLITYLAQTLAEILAATIIVEQIFALPGIGRLMVASIGHRDYPVVQAIVVILAFWVVLSGTIADLINQKIDPRLSFVEK